MVMGAMMGLVCSEEVVSVRHDVSKVIEGARDNFNEELV